MPIVRHPLVVPNNQRLPSAGLSLLASTLIDNRIINAVPQIVDDPIKGEKQVFSAKRGGLIAVATPSTGNFGAAIYRTSADAKISAFAAASNLQTPTIFYNTTNCGAVGSGELVANITEVIRSSISYFMIVCGLSGGAGGASAYFLASDSVSDSTFTGDTHTNTTIDNIAGMTDTLYPGQPISGTGIQAGTRIATVTSATAITTTLATTATNAGVTITKTHLAKIIDADFPTAVKGPFIDLDGFLFIQKSTTGDIYQSDLNSVYSYPASGFIQMNNKSGITRGLGRSNNFVLGLKDNCIEIFRNAGLPSGSVLSRIDTPFINFGVAAGGGGRPIAVNVGESFYFVSSFGGAETSDNETGIYVIEGTTPRLISTGVLNDFLGGQVFSASFGEMSFMSYSGNIVLILEVGISSYNTLFFYPEIGIFTEADFGSDIFQNRGIFVLQDSTGGKTYRISTTGEYQDDSANYDVTLQFDSGDKGTGNQKTIEYYELICDTYTAGTATLYYSDDDCQTFTAFAQTFDLTQARKRIYTGTTYYGKRFLKLVVTGANRAWRGRFIDESFTIATS